VSDVGADRESPPEEDSVSTFQMCRLLIVVFAITVLVAAIPVVLGARRMLAETTDEVTAAELRLAALAAAHADRGLTEAFYEIELMGIRGASGTDDDGPLSPEGELRSVLGEATSFRAGVIVLDAQGNVRYWEPEGLGSDLERSLPADVKDAAAASDDRVVSEPYVDPRTGEVVSALSLPLFTPDGTRQATVIGLYDVGGPLITDLVAPAFDIGETGHSDLVDAHGRVVAAINPAHGLDAGDHPEFYERMARERKSTVERVAHEPSAISLDRSEYHVMAYAPLKMAPWGVAIGASEDDVMATVARQRTTIVVLGLSALAVVVAGLVLAVTTCRRYRLAVDDT